MFGTDSRRRTLALYDERMPGRTPSQVAGRDTSRPYRSLTSLQRDNGVCRSCVEAGYPVGSWPVFEGHAGQRAYLFGLAPGVQEGEDRRPWRGRAGRTLRGWLRLDEEAFYAMFYCASVTRCYPGRHPSGRGT